MTTARTEDIEIANLITQSDDPVLRLRLVDLYRGHGEIQHAGGLIFNLGCEVVVERHVETQQR